MKKPPSLVAYLANSEGTCPTNDAAYIFAGGVSPALLLTRLYSIKCLSHPFDVKWQHFRAHPVLSLY
jgi:hypothetical protein